jgi:hypothetical protein
VRRLGLRLFALLIGLAVIVLTRPGTAVASPGPSHFEDVGSGDVTLHSPRRATVSSDAKTRELAPKLFLAALTSWFEPACAVATLLPGSPGFAPQSVRARWRSKPRGPPVG